MSEASEIGSPPAQPRALALTALLSCAYLALRYLSELVRPGLPASYPLLWIIGALTLLVYLAIVVSLASVIAASRSGAGGLVLAVLLLGGGCTLARWALVARVGGSFWISSLTSLGDLLLVLAALCFGRLVAGMVRDRNLLLPVAIVASIVDFWGVYWGFVHYASEKAKEVVEHFLAHPPLAAAPIAGAPQLGSIGLGDFVFMAVFFALVARYGMALRATAWLSILLLFGAAFAFIHLQVLPGLPFLAAAVLIANWRRFNLSRPEKIMVIWTVVILSAVLVAVTLINRAW